MDDNITLADAAKAYSQQQQNFPLSSQPVPTEDFPMPYTYKALGDIGTAYSGPALPGKKLKNKGGSVTNAKGAAYTQSVASGPKASRSTNRKGQ